jgi:geranylgeranyl diphosphate synthase type 3
MIPDFLDVLQKRTTDHTLKAYTVKIMTDRTKSFAYTRKVLNTLEKQVVDEIKRLGGNTILEAIVGSLSLADIPED